MLHETLRRSGFTLQPVPATERTTTLQDADPTASDDSHPVQPHGLFVARVGPSETNGDRWTPGSAGSVVSCMGRAGIEPATLGLKVASEARSVEISRDETVD
jgi:hypothetical protein